VLDSKFLIILGILALVAVLEIVILMTADKRRRRALAEAGRSQGFQPIPPGNSPKVALVPILEHKYHTWGQVLQGNRGSSEVLLFDYSYSVGKSGCNQTVVAFRDAAASFPKFQLRSNHFLASAGWGAYPGNRVKFEADAAFNKSYLLTGPDPQGLSNFFIPGLRNFLVSMPDHTWTIEGYGNWLVFYRHGKKVKPAALFEFADSAGQVAESIFGLAPKGQPDVSHADDTVIPLEPGALASLAPGASVKFNFKINGHQVSGGKIGNAIEDEIFSKVKEQMAAKMEDLRCPEHDRAPQLEFEGDGLSTMKIRLKTCCESQRKKAVAALGYPVSAVLSS
jgi:hypothetical protein